MENKNSKVITLLKMKIGIVTFQCSHNYGAVLQTYGLQEFLLSKGYDVYIINYNPKYKTRQYSKYSCRHWLSRNPYKCITRFINEIGILKIRVNRWNAFNSFRTNRFRLYPYSKSSDFSEFDYIVLGSDQIWNPGLTGGKFDGIFWGENMNCKVLSYAASTRKYTYTEEEKDYIKKHLEKLSAISVREDRIKNILQSFIEKQITVVLDPSLLAGADIYRKISQKPKLNNYVLIYEIGRNKGTRKLAERIARQKNLKIIELVNSPIKQDSSLNQIASPEEFLGYIEFASYVVTTSFHGVAFSYLFKRNFYALRQNTSADERLSSFLSSVRLIDRFIDMNKNIEVNDIDYEITKDIFNAEYKKSSDYLLKALSI